MRALSTGTADGSQRVIVAALSWSWRSVTVDPLTGEVGADPRGNGPSQADLAALEHALRLAGPWAAKVVAVTVGPPAADAQLHDALAAGAAEAFRVELAGRTEGAEAARLVGGDPAPAAALAAALLRHYGTPDLVLCGDRTADRGTGSFPAFLAAELNAQQALGAVRIEAGETGTLRVTRRLDGGRRAAAAGCPAGDAGRDGRAHSGGPRRDRQHRVAALHARGASLPPAATTAARAVRRHDPPGA